MSLETVAMHWLAYEKKCHCVINERSPRYGIGSPDVLGITKDRFLIEIEIKRSVSDFKINAQKHHIINREHWIKTAPRQFYFFVPEDLLQKVETITPEWAGLACLKDGYNFAISKQAPVNRESQRLSLKECVKLFRCASNQLVSQSKIIERLKDEWKLGHQPWEWYFEI